MHSCARSSADLSRSQPISSAPAEDKSILYTCCALLLQIHACGSSDCNQISIRLQSDCNQIPIRFQPDCNPRLWLVRFQSDCNQRPRTSDPRLVQIAIRGHQRPSAAIGGYQSPSVAIRGCISPVARRSIPPRSGGPRSMRATHPGAPRESTRANRRRRAAVRAGNGPSSGAPDEGGNQEAIREAIREATREVRRAVRHAVRPLHTV